MNPGANRAATMDYKNEATLRSTDSIAASSSKTKNASLDGAMQSFYAGDYKTASGAFDAVLKSEPDNPQALYFGGISDYIDGETAKSEASFDKILKKGTIFIDGAKWYKANILLKKGERDQAKALLQDLSNSNGSYKERAVKKLADLGF
jgi:predicted Zn-dependent protease